MYDMNTVFHLPEGRWNEYVRFVSQDCCKLAQPYLTAEGERLDRIMLAYTGLAGEVAETSELGYQRAIGTRGYPRQADACKELGDVIWYVALLLDTHGITLDQVYDPIAVTDVSVNLEVDDLVDLLFLTTGLVTEMGKVIEWHKKQLFHRKEMDPAMLLKALSRMLWFYSQVAGAYGLKLLTILDTNTQKLIERHTNGYFKDVESTRKVGEYAKSFKPAEA